MNNLTRNKAFKRKIPIRKNKPPFYDFRPVKKHVEESQNKQDNTTIQKFLLDSKIDTYMKPKSCSYSTLKQPTSTTFYYGVKLGRIDQSNKKFTQLRKNNQGICISIAAFCLSVLKHPDKWNSYDIGSVLHSGNNLFLKSAKRKGDPSLDISDLRTYCTLGKQKVRFFIIEPGVSGRIRSEDQRVYNLRQAMQVFFANYNAGIFQTDKLTVAMWKNQSFYFFDAGPRSINLYTHPNGRALLANFYDTNSVIAVLLDRSDLENKPFTIYPIEAYTESTSSEI